MKMFKSLFYDRTALAAVDNAMAHYSRDEFASPTRSTVPLLSLLKHEQPMVSSLLRDMGMPADQVGMAVELLGQFTFARPRKDAVLVAPRGSVDDEYVLNPHREGQGAEVVYLVGGQLAQRLARGRVGVATRLRVRRVGGFQDIAFVVALDGREAQRLKPRHHRVRLGATVDQIARDDELVGPPRLDMSQDCL